MIKQVFIFLLLCGVNGMAFSQEVTVSKEIFLKNDYAYDILGKVEDQFLLFRDKVYNFSVHAYDENLQQKWDREIDFEKKRVKVIGIVPTDSVFNVFYYFRDRGQHVVKMQRMNSDLILQDSMRIIEYKDFIAPKYEMIYSENREKVLMYDFNGDNEIALLAYDLKEMELLWDKKVIFDKGFLRRDFRDILLSNAGNMKLIIERDNSRYGRKKHKIRIIDYNYTNDLISTLELPLEFLTYDVEFKIDNLNKNLVGVGLYTDKNLVKAEGFYFIKVALNNMEYHQLSKTPFDEETVGEIYGVGSKKKKKGINDISVQKIILRQDGGVLAITELNKVFYRRPSYASPLDRGAGAGNWADYYFEDILAVSMHKDGTMHWKKVLHKKQYSQDDDAIYSSFFVMENPSRLRLIFNDEIRNENTVSEYILQGNGLSKRSSVMSTDYQRLKLRFQEAIQVASNQIIVPSERNSRLNLVKITY